MYDSAMRCFILAVAVMVTACGRIGFDATDDALGSDTRGDGNVPLPRSELYVKASNTGSPDFFGASVSLSADGRLLAIGGYQEASNATGVGGNEADNSVSGAGAVYLFTRGASTWTQSAYIKSSNPGGNDQFGFGVDLSADGHTLAVTAVLEGSIATGIDGLQSDNSAFAAGAAYVFTDSGGSWAQQAYIKASNTTGNDQFGYSVAISADGNTLAVGARQEDSGATGVGANEADNSAMESGAIYVFARVGTAWSQQVYIKPTVVLGGNEVGRSIGLSDDGNTLVVSVTYDKSNAVGVGGDDTNTLANASGAAYVFTRTGTVWTQQSYLKASNTNAGDNFAWNVSISGDGSTIAVGAINEASAATGVDGNQLDNTISAAGAVYVFARAGATWMQQAYVKPPNPDTSDHFGWATALTRDGNELVVSATGESGSATGIDGTVDNAASLSGAVYIYTRAAGQWTFASYLKATNTGANDDFGRWVAVASNGTIVCGASGEDSTATGIGGDGTSNGASNSGAAYIFE